MPIHLNTDIDTEILFELGDYSHTEYFEIHDQRIYQPPLLSAYQLAECFPDECQDLGVAVDMMLEYQLQPLVMTIKQIKDSKHPKPLEIFLIFQAIQGWEPLIEYSDKIKSAIAMTTPNRKSSSIDYTAAIAQAKLVPIQDLFLFKNLKPVRGRYVASCPFHGTDSSPSFYIFENNRFHCFGCQAKGTSIDFIMKLRNCDFNKAVRGLVNVSQ